MPITQRWTDTEVRALLIQAEQAGLAAGHAVTPIPMTVMDPATGHVFEPVADGVCGFAWVTIDGRGPLADYAKRSGRWVKGYPKGLTHYVHDFNQSLTRKEAYAHAFAKVLNDAGFKALAGSRMD